MFFQIVDYVFDIDVKKNVYTEYTTDCEKVDFVVKVDNDEILLREEEGSKYNRGDIKNYLILKKVAEWLPLHNAFVLHSACFDVDGVGVAFAAHSGTGKTTHMNLWQKFLGERMTIVNGDKPIVRFFDNEPETPYAYGTPWNGKERLGCNMRTPLKHICFIERSERNYVEKANKQDVIDRIFNQVYMPKDPIAVMNTMQLIDRLLDSCSLWIIHCNMEDDAAKIAYESIFRQAAKNNELPLA